MLSLLDLGVLLAVVFQVVWTSLTKNRRRWKVKKENQFEGMGELPGRRICRTKIQESRRVCLTFGTISPLETLLKSLKLPPEKMIRALGRFMGLGRCWCSELAKEEEPS